MGHNRNASAACLLFSEIIFLFHGLQERFETMRQTSKELKTGMIAFILLISFLNLENISAALKKSKKMNGVSDNKVKR